MIGGWAAPQYYAAEGNAQATVSVEASIAQCKLAAIVVEHVHANGG